MCRKTKPHSLYCNYSLAQPFDEQHTERLPINHAIFFQHCTFRIVGWGGVGGGWQAFPALFLILIHLVVYRRRTRWGLELWLLSAMWRKQRRCRARLFLTTHSFLFLNFSIETGYLVRAAPTFQCLFWLASTKTKQNI